MTGIGRRVLVTVAVVVAFLFRCAHSIAGPCGSPDRYSTRHFQSGLNSENFELFGISLGRDTIHDLQARLGPTGYIAGSDVLSLCYDFSEATNAGGTVTFSSGALDLETISSFEVSDRKSANIADCAKLQRKDRLVSEAGVRLGMTRQEVLSLLGAPVETTNSVAIWLQDLELRDQKTGDSYDQFRGVAVAFRNSEVTCFGSFLYDSY